MIKIQRFASTMYILLPIQLFENDNIVIIIRNANRSKTECMYFLTGEVTEVHTPLGEVCRYQYDAAGNLVAKADEDGLETLYEYNLAGKLAKVAYADGRSVELSYNPLRQLTELRDWLGTTSIEVDALGRAQKVTDHEGKTVQYAWDPLGRRQQITYPDNTRVDYRYNPSGNLAQVLSETGTTEYRYDEMGRIRQRMMPGGIVTEYDLDPLGRLESLVHQKDGEVLDQFRYTYDPAGNITEKLKSTEPVSGRTAACSAMPTTPWAGWWRPRASRATASTATTAWATGCRAWVAVRRQHTATMPATS